MDVQLKTTGCFYNTCRFARTRLRKLRSCLNLQLVKHYRDKKGAKKVVAVSAFMFHPNQLEFSFWLAVINPFKAGGCHLTESSVYPIGLGLKASSQSLILPLAALKLDSGNSIQLSKSLLSLYAVNDISHMIWVCNNPIFTLSKLGAFLFSIYICFSLCPKTSLQRNPMYLFLGHKCRSGNFCTSARCSFQMPDQNEANDHGVHEEGHILGLPRTIIFHYSSGWSIRMPQLKSLKLLPLEMTVVWTILIPDWRESWGDPQVDLKSVSRPFSQDLMK